MGRFTGIYTAVCFNFFFFYSKIHKLPNKQEMSFNISRLWKNILSSSTKKILSLFKRFSSSICPYVTVEINVHDFDQNIEKTHKNLILDGYI